MIHSVLLIFVPLSLMLIALPPRRPAAMLAGAVVVPLLLLGPSGDLLADFGRGWALTLGAWFLVSCVVVRREGFFRRGIAALGAAVVTTAVFFGLHPHVFALLDTAIRADLNQGVQGVLTALGSRATPAVRDAVQQSVALQATLYPSLLAIASLAALAVAWWAYRRIAMRDLDPLSPLRDFRFADGLVWLLIAGLVLTVLPLNQLAERAGSNLLAFMAALYALRGIAVLLVLGVAPGPMGVALAVLMTIVLTPLVVAATFVVGLTDTWLDIRTRRAAEPPGS